MEFDPRFPYCPNPCRGMLVANHGAIRADAAGPPEAIAGAVLTVRLDAIQENWRRLAAKAAPAECGAAVKGNAYGLGVEPVGRPCGKPAAAASLSPAPRKATNCARVLPREAIIYVLDGLFPGQAEFYAQHNLRPALISMKRRANGRLSAGSMAGSFPAPSMSIPASIAWDFPMAEYEALLADDHNH